MPAEQKPVFIATLLTSILLTSPCVAQPDTSPNGDQPFIATLNQQYVERADADRKLLSLDIYRPKKSTGATKVLVYVHGGGWRTGDKSRVNHKPGWLTRNGIAFVSVNYRLYPDVNYRQQAGDLATAIRWIRGQSKRFNIDPDQIYLMGHSSGAHLVALVSTDPVYLTSQGLKTTSLAGVIPVDGAGLDIPYQVELAESVANVQLYQSVFGQDKSGQQAASPFHHLRPGQTYPAFLLAHVASRESTGLQARKFAARLQELGGSAKVIAVQDHTHRSINRDLGKQDDPMSRRVLEFINRASAPHVAGFRLVKIHQTGGFAGVNRRTSLDGQGNFQYADSWGKSRQGKLPADRLAQIQKLIRDTDWSEIPTSARKKNTADDFHFQVDLQTADQIFSFSYDGLSLDDQKSLKRLIDFITN